MESTNSSGSSLGKEAYYGILGEFIRYVEPFTEADPAAILYQAIVGIGCFIGPRVHRFAGDQQRPKLFLVVVGNSAKGRKGTSWGIVYSLISAVDASFAKKCIVNGLGSGEAIIGKLKDPDPTVSSSQQDPRLLISGGEFAQILQVMNRDGNTLSSVIRDGWDNRPLANLIKSGEMRVSQHHIGIISHITYEELLALLKSQNCFNGFANRFIYVWSRRSKTLAFTPEADELVVSEFGNRIRDAVKCVVQGGETNLKFSPQASELWERVYPELSRDRFGLLGVVLSRAEAQVIRIAVVYAVLDAAKWIDTPHLEAALAIWEYSEKSATRIFGKVTSTNADKVIAAIKDSRELRKSDVHDILGNNASGLEIDRIREDLLNHGLIQVTQEKPRKGRPVEVWRLCQSNELN